MGHDLRRAVHLFEMVKRREKSKLAMIDLDSEILEARAKLGDYGSVVYNQVRMRFSIGVISECSHLFDIP